MDIREEGETMKELEELERLASGATDGPWESRTAEIGGSGVIATHPMRGRIDSKITGMKKEDAEYIAAASPDVILSLIRELKITRRALELMCIDYRQTEMADGVNKNLSTVGEYMGYAETEQP